MEDRQRLDACGVEWSLVVGEQECQQLGRQRKDWVGTLIALEGVVAVVGCLLEVAGPEMESWLALVESEFGRLQEKCVVGLLVGWWVQFLAQNPKLCPVVTQQWPAMVSVFLDGATVGLFRRHPWYLRWMGLEEDWDDLLVLPQLQGFEEGVDHRLQVVSVGERNDEFGQQGKLGREELGMWQPVDST